jgi:hypothetical protein
LAYLEAIHFFVEVLDAFFGNVCELDLVFNFYKVSGFEGGRIGGKVGGMSTLFCAVLKFDALDLWRFPAGPCCSSPAAR